MNKELYAGQTIAKEVTFLDGEGAQPFRTTHTKRRKKQKRKKKKQALYRVWREPSHARSAISPAVHAHWCADVRRCGAPL